MRINVQTKASVGLDLDPGPPVGNPLDYTRLRNCTKVLTLHNWRTPYCSLVLLKHKCSNIKQTFNDQLNRANTVHLHWPHWQRFYGTSGCLGDIISAPHSKEQTAGTSRKAHWNVNNTRPLMQKYNSSIALGRTVTTPGRGSHGGKSLIPK